MPEKILKIEKIATGASSHGSRGKRVLLVLNHELLDKVDKVSESEEVSRNSVIVHALRQYLKQEHDNDKESSR